MEINFSMFLIVDIRCEDDFRKNETLNINLIDSSGDSVNFNLSNIFHFFIPIVKCEMK